jgi:hypothetical protein
MDFLLISLLLWRFITTVLYTIFLILIGNYMYRNIFIKKSDMQ